LPTDITHGSMSGGPKLTRSASFMLRTAAGDAIRVTRYGIRDDGPRASECTIFRNESEYLSRNMIRAAVSATIAEWGLSYVDQMVRSSNPDFVFCRRAFGVSAGVSDED